MTHSSNVAWRLGIPLNWDTIPAPGMISSLFFFYLYTK